jgi:Fur family ferric uptake transcriptional regulator
MPPHAVTRDASDPPDRKKLHQSLRAAIARRGLRWTPQRQVIIDRLFRVGGHFTAEALMADVRSADASIGSATIYRTLRLLVEEGLLDEHRFNDGEGTRFELSEDRAHHDHVICVECGLIREFEEPLIEQLQERIAREHGFTLESHAHQLYGRCEKCARELAESPPGQPSAKWGPA